MNFNVDEHLVHDYRRVAKTYGLDVSSSLRLHMAQTVAEARDENGELPVAA